MRAMAWFTAVKTATGDIIVEQCLCGAEGEFGYRDKVGGEMTWCCAQHRLAQCWADTRIEPHTTDALTEADGTRPPDLQALVAEYGGYDKITPEAWAAYDAAAEGQN
jgi:hypothetical protein